MHKGQVGADQSSSLTDLSKGFRDDSVYRLEQPRLPEDMHARLKCRQHRASPNAAGFSPVQRRSPIRMLPSPMRSARADFASIFVGGLPPTVTQDYLLDIFQVYGQILQIDIVHKASMNSVYSSVLHTYNC